MSLKTTLAAMGAVVTCPCHLPIWIVLLGGTAVGAALSENLVLIFGVATVLFLGFLFLALSSYRSPARPRSQEADTEECCR